MSILANIGSCSKNIIIYFIGMTIRPRAFAILLNIVIDSIFSTRQNFINNNVLCFILIYSFGILIFMYIFGYFFFQKGHFKGSSKNRPHRQKYCGEGRGMTIPLSSLLWRACKYSMIFCPTHALIVFF